MAKKYNEDLEINMDDDTELDFSEFDDPFSTPPPKNKREAVIASLKDGAMGMTETVTSDPIEFSKKFVENALPPSLQGDFSQIGSEIGSLRDEFIEGLTDVRKNGRRIMRTIEAKLPDSAKESAVFKAVQKVLGEDKVAAKQAIDDKEARLTSSITKNIIEVMGVQQGADEQRKLLMESIQNKRALASIDLQRQSVTYLEKLYKFQVNVTNAYMRKSLELNYRRYHMANEHLKVTKQAIDSFRNQFESIVHNTALPDIVKLRKAEVIKASVFQHTVSGYLSRSSLLSGVRRNVMNGLSRIRDGIGGVSDLAEQGTAMNPAEFGISKSNLAGGLVGDALADIVATKLGRRFSNTKTGSAFYSKFRNVVTDPSEMFAAQAEKGGALSGIYGGLSRLTKNTEAVNAFNIERGAPEDVTQFDNRTKSSITKVIPGFLSKILREVTRISTGKDVGETKYDYTTDAFYTGKEAEKLFNKRINKRIEMSGASQSIDNLIKQVAFSSGTKFTAGEVAALKRGLMGYLMSGKTIMPERLEKNGFYGFFSASLGKKFKKAVDSYIDPADKKAKYTNLTEMTRLMNDVKKTLPSPKEILEEYAAGGSMDIAAKSGMIKTDFYTGRSQFTSAAYNKAVQEYAGKDVKDIYGTEAVDKTARTYVRENVERNVNNFGKKMDGTTKVGRDQVEAAKKIVEDATGVNVDGVAKKIDENARKATSTVREAYADTAANTMRSTQDRVDELRSTIGGRFNSVKSKVMIKTFIADVQKQIDALQDASIDLPGIKDRVRSKAEALRSRLKQFETTNFKNSIGLNDSVNDITDRLQDIADTVTPSTAPSRKEREESREEDVDDDTLFFKAVNSQDPVGYISREIRRKTTSRAKKMLFGSVKGTFNLAKNIVAADLRRGAKLRSVAMAGINKLRRKKDGSGYIEDGDNDDLSAKNESILKKTARGVAGVYKMDRGVSNALFKTVPSIIKSTMNSALTGIGSILYGSKKPTNRFDTDADGMREGSWLERLKNMGRKDKTAKTEKATATKPKEEGGDSLKLTGILAAVAGLLSVGKTMLGAFTEFVPSLIKGFGSIMSPIIALLGKAIPGLGKTLSGPGKKPKTPTKKPLARGVRSAGGKLGMLGKAGVYGAAAYGGVKIGDMINEAAGWETMADSAERRGGYINLIKDAGEGALELLGFGEEPAKPMKHTGPTDAVVATMDGNTSKDSQSLMLPAGRKPKIYTPQNTTEPKAPVAETAMVTSAKIQAKTHDVNVSTNKGIMSIAEKMDRSIRLQEGLLQVMADVAGTNREISQKEMMAMQVESDDNQTTKSANQTRVEKAHEPKVDLSRKKYHKVM